MADRLLPEERSKNMAAIKSMDTKPEIYIRHKLFSMGYRYRKNYSKVIGHPDIYLAKYRTAIFVNGCFWHRHNGCTYAYTPHSHIEFWEKKFQDNIRRDNTVKDELRKAGIKCLIVWECTVKEMIKFNARETEIMNKISEFLDSEMMYMEI